ncbi:MAG: hypothetical protein BGO77_06520 [Caedibacter sp. 37-49]|nr:MAG: hypothetical protein BGO77_06520 [Caedibacter sp. 37-49]
MAATKTLTNTFLYFQLKKVLKEGFDPVKKKEHANIRINVKSYFESAAKIFAGHPNVNNSLDLRKKSWFIFICLWPCP